MANDVSIVIHDRLMHIFHRLIQFIWHPFVCTRDLKMTVRPFVSFWSLFLSLSRSRSLFYKTLPLKNIRIHFRFLWMDWKRVQNMVWNHKQSEYQTLKAWTILINIVSEHRNDTNPKIKNTYFSYLFIFLKPSGFIINWYKHFLFIIIVSNGAARHEIDSI